MWVVPSRFRRAVPPHIFWLPSETWLAETGSPHPQMLAKGTGASFNSNECDKNGQGCRRLIR